MTSTTELKFDEQVIEISLAKEYLEKNSEIHSIGYRDNDEIEYDVYKNKIYLSDYSKENATPLIARRNLESDYLRLAESLKKNMELFCQLEYLLRMKSLEEVRNLDMKLLLLNLIYQNLFGTAEKVYISEIVMTAETPLANLGCIAQSSVPTITILSTKETAVICSLFVTLCLESGLENIRLMLVSNPAPRTPLQCMNLSNVKELQTGCVGIVTEKADIDSAIDTFLYATSQYPWHFKKIFVQECVLNRFKKSLEWKTKKPSVDVEEHIVRSCTSVHAYDDKLYLFEFAGDVNSLSDKSIVIEAYRTTKELMSIMGAMKPICVSLWSSHVAESNEIAFGLQTNIVWINDYGCFEGPAVTSQAFYSLLHRHLDRERVTGFPVKDVLKIREKWLKSEITTRFIKLAEIKYKFRADGEYAFRINPNDNNSNTSVGSKLCIALREPVNVIVVNVETLRNVNELLDFIAGGGAAILIVNNNTPEIFAIRELYRALQNIDAPVVLFDDDIYKLDEKYKDQLRYNTKVIWSSIGTIFAN